MSRVRPAQRGGAGPRRACRHAWVLVLLLAASASEARGQSFLDWSGLQAGPHAVGFRSWTVTDDTRTLGRPVDTQGRPRKGFGSRKLQVALWYPAAAGATPKAMTWGDYVPLLAPNETPAAVAAELAALRSITPGASPELPGVMDRFRAQKVHARKDARAAPGRFPVVVYAPGGGYPVFDNSVLCELLASHGFVVISTPTFGDARRPLSYTSLNLEAGARDLELLAGQVRSLAQADAERLAVVGFSWGGIPAGLLAMRNGRVRSLVSLDSTLGDTGLGKLTKTLSGFDPARLRVPLLAFTTAPGKGITFEEGSPLGTAARADLTRVGLLHAEHHDLASFSGLLRRSAGPASKEVTATYELVCRMVLAFLEATLRDRPWAPAADPGLATVTRRPAAQGGFTRDDLFDLLDTSGVSGALEALHARRAGAAADFAPFEAAVNQAGYALFGQGRGAEALLLFSFNVESFPASFNAWDSLAEAQLASGDLVESERCYREARARVERDPSLAPDVRAAHLTRIDAALGQVQQRRTKG